MEAQDRLVSRSPRPLVFGIALAVALAVVVSALVLVTVVIRGAGTSTSTTPAAASSSEGVRPTYQGHRAPDAKERADIYAQAIADRYKNMSPDGLEKNEQASGG